MRKKLCHTVAINEGISKAKGEYILILKADIRKGN
jgi:glycosyltransferase involved in cell wall biosynthesis